VRSLFRTSVCWPRKNRGLSSADICNSLPSRVGLSVLLRPGTAPSGMSSCSSFNNQSPSQQVSPAQNEVCLRKTCWQHSRESKRTARKKLQQYLEVWICPGRALDSKMNVSAVRRWCVKINVATAACRSAFSQEPLLVSSTCLLH